MTNSIWQPVPRANFMFLRAARLQAHTAAQWLARASRAYVPAQADDRHTSFGWDDAFGGLTTHPLPDGSRLGLRIADLTLAFLDVHPRELALDGRADAEVRAWLGARLASAGLDAGKLDAPLPYAIPEHALALGARYSLDELGDAFGTLSAWSANASAALASVQQRLAGRKLKAPRVRCWPHHFDFDCLVALGRGRTMGVGFCPGDEFCDEPYSTRRCGRSRRSRACRCCRPWRIGTLTSSSPRWRPRTRSLRRTTRAPTCARSSMWRSQPRSTRWTDSL
jgi:hypothetical protein